MLSACRQSLWDGRDAVQTEVVSAAVEPAHGACFAFRLIGPERGHQRNGTCVPGSQNELRRSVEGRACGGAAACVRRNVGVVSSERTRASATRVQAVVDAEDTPPEVQGARPRTRRRGRPRHCVRARVCACCLTCPRQKSFRRGAVLAVGALPYAVRARSLVMRCDLATWTPVLGAGLWPPSSADDVDVAADVGRGHAYSA
jgi:hypothetical protein